MKPRHERAWEIGERLAEMDVLEEKLRIAHKVRAYVAFVLTGDEKADVQLAADNVKLALQGLAATLKQIASDCDELSSLPELSVGEGRTWKSVARTARAALKGHCGNSAFQASGKLHGRPLNDNGAIEFRHEWAREIGERLGEMDERDHYGWTEADLRQMSNIALPDQAASHLAMQGLAEALEETREAAAACFRVICRLNGSEAIEKELKHSPVKDGFGVRAAAALDRAKPFLDSEEDTDVGS